MYLQHTTSDPDGVMPVKVSHHPDDGKVVVRWGRFGDVYLSLSPAEAERLRDGLSAALADRQAVAR